MYPYGAGQNEVPGLSVLKIGEFSQLGRVSVRMLRHYDATGLLKPAEVDNISGYRFYDVEQLPRLNRILALKDLGLSLEQVGSLLAVEDPQASELRGMLAMRRADLEGELREGRERLARVEARLRQIEREDEPSPYEVILKEVAPVTVASARTIVPTIPDMPDYRCDMYKGLYAWLDAHEVKPASVGPEMAVYHATEFAEHDIDMEAAVVIGSSEEVWSGSQTAVQELPACDVASVVHRGPLWDVPDAISALFAWIGENGCSAAGPYREVHLFWRENDLAASPGGLESVVIEMQLPVGKTAL